MYVARDIQTGADYALKRLFGLDKDECNNIIREVNIHKQVSGHPNIVKFIKASFTDQRQNNGRVEYLLVTELCKGGSLYDCLDQQLEPPTVLKIIYQATRAVAHLHSQGINHELQNTQHGHECGSRCAPLEFASYEDGHWYVVDYAIGCPVAS